MGQSGKARQEPEVRTSPKLGWEGWEFWAEVRHRQAQVGKAGQGRQGHRWPLSGTGWGLGGQVTSRGGREYLGAPPSPGLGTPVLPAHLLPEERLSIYQKAREKRHIT